MLLLIVLIISFLLAYFLPSRFRSKVFLIFGSTLVFISLSLVFLYESDKSEIEEGLGIMLMGDMILIALILVGYFLGTYLRKHSLY